MPQFGNPDCPKNPAASKLGPTTKHLSKPKLENACSKTTGCSTVFDHNIFKLF
jgi:hypothetical protein